MAAEGSNFFDWVQSHEREWGKKSYTGRPSLQSMMSAHVVVFWRETGATADKKPFYVVTLHDTLDELQRYFGRMLFTAAEAPPARTVAAIFADGKRVRVTGVKVEFRVENA